MLLVLGDVTGDRLVTELRQLDPDLGGGDAVGPVADHGPVAPPRGQLPGGLPDALPVLEDPGERVGQAPQRGQHGRPLARVRRPELLGQGGGEQDPRGHLGVEGLGRGDAHLHVPPVGGVEDAVGLVGQVAAPTVDDGHDGAPSGADQVDRPVGVGGGPGLGDGHDQGVGHVLGQLEPGQFGGHDGLHPHRAVGGERLEGGRQALPGDGGRALAGDEDPVDAALPQPRPQLVGQRLRPELHGGPAVPFGQPPPQGLAERGRGLGHLLEQEVREVAPVDVPGRDLGRLQVSSAATGSSVPS